MDANADADADADADAVADAEVDVTDVDVIDPDVADLAAIAAGDVGAMERLYGRHREALFAFIRRHLADRQLAEEALQDTMVAVWEGAGDFRGDSRVRTWMFSIARLKALGIARVRRPEPVDPTGRDAASLVVDTAPGPARQVLARDELDRVDRALHDLPHEQRECFLLAVAGSIGYADIASMLGVSVGTVKSRVSRARRHLDHALADRAGTPPSEDR